jgi:hypothetical protein
MLSAISSQSARQKKQNSWLHWQPMILKLLIRKHVKKFKTSTELTYGVSTASVLHDWTPQTPPASDGPGHFFAVLAISANDASSCAARLILNSYSSQDSLKCQGIVCVAQVS